MLLRGVGQQGSVKKDADQMFKDSMFLTLRVKYIDRGHNLREIIGDFMLKKAKGLVILIRKGKKTIAVTLGWAIAISLIIIRAYETFYLENLQFSVYKIALLSYKGPAFTDFDYLLLAVIAFLVGFTLVDAKSIIYGYFGSMFLSSLIAVIYVFLYVWFTLGLRETLSEISFGWELALFQAIVNIFRFMIPIGILFSLIGVVSGSVIRIWLKP